MNRQEFLDELRRTLNRELDAAEVADNLNYYSSYIEEQMRKGKTESQVLEELGDPKLIARTILTVDEQREEHLYGGSSAQSVYTEYEDGAYQEEPGYETYESAGANRGFQGKHFSVKASSWKGWAILILILLVVFAVLGTTFMILWRLLPVILIACGITWVYHRFIQR